ncbi:hypothetical protein ILUMI_21793 [Ignelater luminosus]|uniref:Reverse transcriptase domain-containing protein n=1 Tax=Ignelater luminosus TaxID=2038154 RepID=A0A8K0G3E9_IGNLU|nr:hypothetical protein ILUMI_21793 [Ignelater luminosus]
MSTKILENDNLLENKTVEMDQSIMMFVDGKDLSKDVSCHLTPLLVLFTIFVEAMIERTGKSEFSKINTQTDKKSVDEDDDSDLNHLRAQAELKLADNRRIRPFDKILVSPETDDPVAGTSRKRHKIEKKKKRENHLWAKSDLQSCQDEKTGLWPENWSTSILLPLHKKGPTTVCDNYRLIALISHPSKIMLYILQARLQTFLTHQIAPEQAGFVNGRGTREQILNAKQLIEKAREYSVPIYLCFVDYEKAFDNVRRPKLWTTLGELGRLGERIPPSS